MIANLQSIYYKFKYIYIITQTVKKDKIIKANYKEDCDDRDIDLVVTLLIGMPKSSIS